VVTVMEEAALEVDAKALQRALTRLIRVYRFRDHQAVCCYDVSAAQCHGLEFLAESGGATLGGFAAALFLEKSSASRMIDGLVRKGYVRRDPHPEDRRSLQLRLTPEGAALAETLERDMLSERRLVLEGFGAEERETIIAAVQKLADQAVGCCTPEPDESCAC